MSKIREILPSCAFMINGTFVEDLVDGYNTLNALTGKNTIAKEFRRTETEIKSGAILLGSTFPVREIEIDYLIRGKSWQEMQESYTQLMGVLDVEQAQIIFNGEPDKYIVGSFTFDSSEIDTTQNTRYGKFKIVCFDPFKYSTTEKEVVAQDGQFNVNYEGTYKSYPTLIAEFPATYDSDGQQTNNNECGFVGFVNEHNDILQFGDPEQTDWADVQYPVTRPINQKFTNTSGWLTNGSQVISATQVGTIQVTSAGRLQANSYGSGTAWHGPSLSKIITGEVQPIAKNFTFSWSMKFAGTKKQFGGFQCLLYNNNSGVRTRMAAVRILKTTKDTKCDLYFYVAGQSASIKGVACSKIGSCKITKSGNAITFNVGGKTKKIADDSIADLVANEVCFWFGRKASQTVLGSNYVTNCLLERSAFVNNEDIENTFAPGQVLTVDTQTAEVFLDDGSAEIPAQQLGALGNDWEGFYLRKGMNIIATDYSDFTVTPPVFKLKYRERFL